MSRFSALGHLALSAILCLLVAGCQKDESSGSTLAAYTVEENVVYGTARNYQNQQQSLGMDVYMPQGNQEKYPLLVTLHGGGFYTGERKELDEFCRFFAQRKFTAVNISYRLGWNIGNGTNFCSGNAYSVIQAGYRATQDLHAALRYLVANAERFKIDTSKIFVGGNSAGSIAALSVAFVSQSEFNKFYPNIEAQLGSIHNSGHNTPAPFRIRGVLNMWGGIMDPSVVGSNDNIAVIGFHGSGDPIVPYGKGHFAGCTEYPEFYGSKSLYDVLRANGQAAVLHTENANTHGAYNFNYLAQNSYCFIKQVINGQKPTGAYANNISECP